MFNITYVYLYMHVPCASVSCTGTLIIIFLYRPSVHFYLRSQLGQMAIFSHVNTVCMCHAYMHVFMCNVQMCVVHKVDLLI